MRIVLTGAGRGLGLELARQLSARGDHVEALVRDPSRATDLASLPRVTMHRCDVADQPALESLAAALGAAPVDLLINNAGVKPHQSLPHLDASHFDEAFRINAIGPLLLARALTPALRAANGKVLHVTTQLASIANARGGNYAYRMSKAALNMGIRVLAKEQEADGLVHVLMHPGWVKTDMGGPNAPLEASESARLLLSFIDRATLAESGRFFDHEGHELPW